MEIKETTSTPITRVQIARYAGAVGDFNPIHLDDEFAKKAGLPSIIAHGPLTVAIAVDAVVSQVGVEALKRIDARLKAPVFPGSVLTVAPVEGGVEVRTQDGKTVVSATLAVSGRA